MAVSTARVRKPTVPGAERFTVTTVTFDSSYQEGGEPLTPKELGLKRVTFAICVVTNGSEEATVRATDPFYTPSTEKIHLIDNATGKEVASTKNMEKVKVQVFAFGS